MKKIVKCTIISKYAFILSIKSEKKKGRKENESGSKRRPQQNSIRIYIEIKVVWILLQVSSFEYIWT